MRAAGETHKVETTQETTRAETTREGEIRRMLRDLCRNAQHRLAGHRVVVFGSRARGDAKPRSDFDVGVIGETPLPLEDFYALEDQMEDLPTLYRIDWVDLSRASASFRHEAMADMQVIYEA